MISMFMLVSGFHFYFNLVVFHSYAAGKDTSVDGVVVADDDVPGLADDDGDDSNEDDDGE